MIENNKDKLPDDAPDLFVSEEQPALFDMPADWNSHWQNMPEFKQRDLMPWQSIKVHFRNRADRAEFSEMIEQSISDLTPSVWFPKEERKRLAFDSIDYERKQPKYPIFIPSKGRSDSRFTVKAFEATGTAYKIVIERQEYDAYAENIDPANIIVLPFSDQGLVATRNWIWDYAQKLGTPRFWTFDDNIKGFMWLINNEKIRVTDGAMFALIEDFVDRYENIPIAGCNYQFFAKNKQELPPFILNTRIYSNMLIETAAPFRNEGFYNDDTDLCLRVLKAGLCTVQFNAFLIDKATTMSIKGGMTGHYQGDGRYKMAKELRDKHSDVVTITQKFGRYQHQVNYSGFKKNKLILKKT